MPNNRAKQTRTEHAKFPQQSPSCVAHDFCARFSSRLTISALTLTRPIRPIASGIKKDVSGIAGVSVSDSQFTTSVVPSVQVIVNPS